jgi:hypothetical protein
MYYINKSTEEYKEFLQKNPKDKNMFLMLMTNTMTHAPKHVKLENDPSQTIGIRCKNRIWNAS